MRSEEPLGRPARARYGDQTVELGAGRRNPSARDRRPRAHDSARHAGSGRSELAARRAARPGAARRLSLSRKAFSFRSRANTRARRERARLRRARLFRNLRFARRRHERRPVPTRRRGDARVRAVLDGRWAAEARSISRATCAASRSSSTRNAAIGTSSATTCRCSSSRIRSSSRISSTPRSRRPDRDFPQAQSAHDNFWDFVSLMPESMHMVHVADVGPRYPALVPLHGGLRRPHVPARQRSRSLRRS